MSKAIEQIARIYTRTYHQPVRIVKGASGELLEDIVHARVGDVYLPGNPRYITDYADATLFPYRQKVASMQLVCFTRPGNPLGVHRLEDLTRPQLRVGIGHPELGSVGKVTRYLITEHGGSELYRRIAYNALYFASDSYDMNRLYRLRMIDVGISWKPAVSALFKAHKAEQIVCPHARKHAHHSRAIMAAAIGHSSQPEAAKRFVQTLLTPEAQSIFKSEGFDGR
jgi:molybdate transport system substrate-binding protein